MHRPAASLFLLTIAWCTHAPASEPATLAVWRVEAGEHSVGVMAAVREFERRHPQVRVQIGVLPVSNSMAVMDPQKLICAIAGGRPPDVVYPDRFTIGSMAARGAFTDLAEWLHESDAPRPDDYYPACWEEVCYGQRVFAIPDDVDVRVLMYNEDLLREAGYVDAATGGVRLPQDWDELKEYAVRLTRRDALGRLERVGFVPNFGNAWLYLYGYQRGATFLSADGRTCTLAGPESVAALEWLTEVYDAVGGAKAVASFRDTFQTGVNDPFLTGQLVMKVEVDTLLRDVARYRPDMNVGIAAPPPPVDGRMASWSGGYAWAVPRGCRHPREAWAFIKWMTSAEGRDVAHRAQWRHNRAGGAIYFPRLPALRSGARELLERYGPESPRLRELSLARLELLEFTRIRPVSPAGAVLWDAQARAIEMATRHQLSSQAALELAEREVQTTLDELNRPPEQVGPVVGVGWPIAVGVLALLGGAATGVAWVRRSRGVDRRAGRQALVGLAFVSPWLIGFIVLTLWPVVDSAFLSLCRYDALSPRRWVGLQNFIQLARDPLFWKSLWNTAVMGLSVPMSMAVGLSIALLLHRRSRGIELLRTAYFLPAIVPSVVASVLWIWVLAGDRGLLNELLRPLLATAGLPAPNWLQSEAWAKPAIMLTLLWAAGGSMVIWLAGLNAIPAQLYEAAHLDGAGATRRLVSITLPMLTPHILFNLVIGMIGVFQIFNQAFIMTEGGPNDATRFYVLRLFDVGFRYFEFGSAAAMAWILFIIVLALTLLTMKLTPHWVHYRE